MEYPLELSSGVAGPDASIADANGAVVFRSDGSLVFAGGQRVEPSYRVKLETTWMGLSPRCHITDLDEKPICTLRAHITSLWKSSYSVLADDRPIVTIREGKALAKTLGGLLDGTPLAEVSSHVWNPAFVVARPNNTVVMHLEKRRSIRGRFTIERKAELDESEETMVLLSLFGLVLLERIYG